jgi:RNA polymerase sigma-70 factor (ECF subfamily)
MLAIDGSPVIALNRAVALAEVHGPDAAIAAADAIPHLDAYHLYHATLGELHLRAGHRAEAARHFTAALKLTENKPEQDHLRNRMNAALREEVIHSVAG